MSGTTTKASSNRGRPRKIGSSNISAKEAIIAVASDLFRERGYAKTSFTEIARHINIDPSSLYYWFPSKEAILEYLFNVSDLAPFIEYTNTIQPTSTVKLYVLIINDVVRKCDLPFDFAELESLAHDNPERFEYLFTAYRATYQAMVDTIKQGIASKEFVPCDAEERAVTILSINEGLQHHYHAKERNELILESSGYTVRNHAPKDIGHMAAINIIPALVSNPVNMEDIKKESGRIIHNFVAANSHLYPR